MTSFTVSALNIYPVKSCRGIPVTEATLQERGFQYDRRWMIADASGKFLTQREHPRLALIQTSLTPDGLLLKAPELSALLLPLRLEGSPGVQAQIWSNTVGAIQGGREAQDWISSYLGFPAQFLYMPETSRRPVNPDYVSKGEIVSFADAFPFLLISEGSLTDLNSRLSVPLPMNRFRPNIVVNGCAPYSEDTWKKIRIGKVPFRVAKPCDRCATTLVDQETGVKGLEPLRTLSTYRTVDGNVLFGQNIVQEGGGSVRVGDEVTVL